MRRAEGSGAGNPPGGAPPPVSQLRCIQRAAAPAPPGGPRGEWGGPCPGLPGHQLLRTQPWAEAAPSPSSARGRRRQFQPGCRPHRRRQARDTGPVPVPERAGGRGPGRCWRQACAKCRLPGQQRDRGSGAGVGRGSEVSAPRKRPPAGPPGHRERAAEALSGGSRGQDPGADLFPRGQMVSGVRPCWPVLQAGGSGEWTPRPQESESTEAAACPAEGRTSVQRG